MTERLRFTSFQGLLIFHCVHILFWLIDGEVTGNYSRNLVLSLKLPSSTWVKALTSAEELRDIVMHFPKEEPRPSFTSALLFLTCFSFVSAFPPFQINSCLNLPFGTQRALNGAYFLQIRNGGTERLYPTGCCSLSYLSIYLSICIYIYMQTHICLYLPKYLSNCLAYFS